VSAEPGDARTRAPAASVEGFLAALEAIPDAILVVDEDGRILFEPFFTTKDSGTGLGLATVFGIVEQSGGHVSVRSAPGQGAAFTILLPRAEVGAEEGGSAPAVDRSPRGSETVLLVEDEESVRALAGRILSDLGYRVLVAASGAEALRLARQLEAPIDLLVADVVMPGMSGPELVERLAVMGHDLPVVYVSGHAEESILRHGASEPGTDFLPKPFTPAALARIVCDVLDHATR